MLLDLHLVDMLRDFPASLSDQHQLFVVGIIPYLTGKYDHVEMNHLQCFQMYFGFERQLLDLIKNSTFISVIKVGGNVHFNCQRLVLLSPAPFAGVAV